MYLTVGNIPDHLRSHIYSIKLVALCKEVDFDHNKVYGPIVDALKKLENGIEINGHIMQGSLVYMSGDNLGNHALGGFVENLSTTKYICRFCLATREEFHEDTECCKTY